MTIPVVIPGLDTGNQVMRAKARTNNNVFMTWVPWLNHGMTEFFAKNSVCTSCDKLLFIEVLINRIHNCTLNFAL